MRAYSLALIIAASLTSAACGPRNQDRLDDKDLVDAAAPRTTAADERCARRATSDEVKNQLFARAATIRGSNAGNYAKISSFALIDLVGVNPVAAVSEGELIDCRGRATLRLPAGLKVAGGRTALTGDISYSVAPGALGTVSLGQSDSIAIPLATLMQVRAAPRPTPTPSSDSLGPRRDVPPAPPAPLPIPRAERQQPPSAEPTPAPPVARPSFDCRRARTAGERAVCDSPALAGLDRQMAAQYRSALANGSPEVRQLLVQTRDRFLSYRDRCGSDACIAATYRGRMREIGDIVAGRWRVPR